MAPPPRILLLLALLGGCTLEKTPAPGVDPGLQAFIARAQVIGTHTRASIACNVPFSAAAQDRAAAIEATAIDLLHREGGTGTRDDYLRGLAPPVFDPAQQGRDRARWCATRQADIARVARWLDSDEGAAFAAHTGTP